jgi:PIN domain nuclease of toxin-antitoxin system
MLSRSPRPKTQLSRLIERAQAGEEIVIRCGQRPVAKLIAFSQPAKRRQPGALAEEGFTELRVSAAHGLAASALPQHHGNPFDRMLVAQAQSERRTLLTRDERIALYDISVLW